MNRPSRFAPGKREHLDINAIQTAFDMANIGDMRNAEDIQKFSIQNGYRASDSIAAGIRFGFIRGKANGNRRAQEAHNRLHDFLGTRDKNDPPADRIRHAAYLIDSPDVLRELAAFLAGRAAMLEACNETSKPVDDTPATPDHSGTPDNDVNSDGEMEVCYNG